MKNIANRLRRIFEPLPEWDILVTRKDGTFVIGHTYAYSEEDALRIIQGVSWAEKHDPKSITVRKARS
jgi:hypothetical protein